MKKLYRFYAALVLLLLAAGCDGGGETDISDPGSIVPPNVFLVLDRSGSMSLGFSSFPIPNTPTRFDVVIAGISDFVTTREADIRFGLLLYPGTTQNCSAPSECGFGIVAVDPGPSTATAINSYLTSTSICTGGGTPTHLALQQALSSGGVQDPSRPNFVILLTDGVSVCEGIIGDTSTEAVQAVTSLNSANPSVKTFVVVIVPGLLDVYYNDMAIAGKVPKASGPPHYYEVNSGTDLETALDTIAGVILSSP